MSATRNLLDMLAEAAVEPLADGITRLPGFVGAADLAGPLQGVIAAAPLRHMRTPGGQVMSVAMTNCGAFGWISDRRGYRYSPVDPDSGKPWPDMPASFQQLATAAAEAAGFSGFAPDVCLINRYEPGTRLSLHQDRDERDFDQPIVSVSLGLPATFLIGGLERRGPTCQVRLFDGDVIVFGGPARLIYHGIKPIEDGEHPLLGACRINLTFRKAN
ncbi:MAG TPA: DNA oxidative demethylase AlkB [Gammaproteobacteria bacterium]|nr:DNA oxidative demethylase AlkB [Gammaproteobacteria bacterium]